MTSRNKDIVLSLRHIGNEMTKQLILISPPSRRSPLRSEAQERTKNNVMTFHTNLFMVCLKNLQVYNMWTKHKNFDDMNTADLFAICFDKKIIFLWKFSLEVFTSNLRVFPYISCLKKFSISIVTLVTYKKVTERSCYQYNHWNTFGCYYFYLIFWESQFSIKSVKVRAQM